MSTDSDPPTDDEQVRELVRDELANALEEADIDLGDLPQEEGTTRRDVLKSAGLAGAAGLTGAAGMNSATDSVSAGTQSSGDVGAAGNPVDVVAEDVYGPGGQGSGDAVAFEAIEANEVFSNALPTAVRLFKDDSGNAVAIAQGGSTPIASGSNHAQVIQSAIDHITTTDSSGSGPQHLPLNGYIDGGGLTYTLTQGVSWKDRVGLRNMVLDANGNTGFVPLSSPSAVNGIWGHNVIVRDSGDSDGIDVSPIFHSLFTNVASFGHAGRGIVCRGGISSRWYNIYAHSNGGPQMLVTNDGTTRGNDNTIRGGNFDTEGSTGTAIRVYVNPADVTAPEDTQVNRIIGCSFQGTGDGVHLDDGAVGTMVKWNYFEGDTSVNIDAPNTVANFNSVTHNRIQSIVLGNCFQNLIQYNRPHRGNSLSVTLGSSSNRTYLDHNRNMSLTDNSTSVNKNYVDKMTTEGLGDPSSAPTWNPYHNGVVVRNSNANNNDTYMFTPGDIWVQIG